VVFWCFGLSCREDCVLVYGRFRLRESKVFERTLIRRLIIKAVSVEIRDCELLCALLNSYRLVSYFLHLVRREAHFVLRVGAEGQSVDWILGVFLVEHIRIAVLPVGVIHLVTAHELHGALPKNAVVDFGFGTLALLAIMNDALGSVHVHCVRVDDFSFLLEIKCLLVIFGVCVLTLEFFLIEGGGLAWIGVSDEPVVAAGTLAIQMVPSWQLLKGSRRPQLVTGS